MKRQNNCKGRRSWITKDKAFFRYNRTIEYIILTKTVTACTRSTQAQDRETPSEEEESRHNLPPLAKHLFKVHRFWERENQYPSMEWRCYINHISEYASCSEAYGQQKSKSLAFCDVFSLVLFSFLRNRVHIKKKPCCWVSVAEGKWIGKW